MRTKKQIVLVVFAIASIALVGKLRIDGAQAGRFVLDGPLPPQSLEEMCRNATLIVEAYVQRVYDSTALEPKSPILATDSLLSVARTFKGNAPSLIVVSQIGGPTQNPSQYSMMKAGERYILFLNKPDLRGLAVLPDREGLPRFSSLGYVGVFKLDGEKTRLSPDLPDRFRKTYDGIPPSQMFQAIVKAVATR